MAARIYRPAKTAMQSGKAKSDSWMLEFEPEQPRKVEPLMGYTSSGDMKSQIRLSFETREEAVAYAQKNGIAYSVQEPKETRRRVVSYSENFRFDRKQPWTH
ncbi:MAG: ETC complex I subunit [Phyllobacterium sp.]